MSRLVGFVRLAAAVGLLTAGPARAWSFTAEERAFLAGHHALLEASPDPCRVATRLETQYKRLLREASPKQDVDDILAAAAGKPGVPLVLAEGVRLTEGFALYDDPTRTIYLSSAALTPRMSTPGGGCPSDLRIAALARQTVGVYVHELSHSLERNALGAGYVATSEGEILAYAREARFLAGQKGWPGKAVADEFKRRRALDEQIAENREIIGRVKELRGQEADENSFRKLGAYVETLEEIKQRIAHLQARAIDVDPLQLSLAEMVDAWRAGWVPFLHLMIPQTSSRPSVSRREENLGTARRFLESSRMSLERETPGTLAHQIAARSVALGEQDIRFWGDPDKVEQALTFYQRRFKEVRPTPDAR